MMCDITPIKSFQPWKIDVVDKSLNYAKDREARKIALTFSSAYATIKEWDYLVSKREQVQGFPLMFGYAQRSFFNDQMLNKGS